MIQRIQTLFLLFAAGVMVCFSLMEIGQVQTEGNTWLMTASGLAAANGSQTIATWHTLIVSLLCALLPFVAIFLYKNQGLQKRLCYLTILLSVALYAVVIYEGYRMVPGTQETSWNGTVVGPLLAICLCALAAKYIQKDIDLIRSSDRLR